MDEIDKTYRIRSHQGVPLHFLELLQKDLEERSAH
jgi:hypothetical protein